jgi:hypothetical protein
VSYLVRWLWERTARSRSQSIGLYSALMIYDGRGPNAELDIVTLYVMNDEAQLECDDVSAHVLEPRVQIDRNRNTSSSPDRFLNTGDDESTNHASTAEASGAGAGL